MPTKQLFETTLYSEDRDVALTVVSVPTEQLPDPTVAGSPSDVMAALRLQPLAEVPGGRLADALAAILANGTAQEAVEWLREPPNAAPVELGEDVKSAL